VIRLSSSIKKMSLFDDFQMTLSPFTSGSRFERERHNSASVKRSMVAFILLGFMKGPVFFKVVAGAQRTKPQDGLGTSKTPSSPGQFHSVFDQMSAGTFNDPGGNRKALAKIAVVLEIGCTGEQVIGADIDRISFCGDKTSQCGGAD
jgi:hypothetical protein